MDIAPLIEIGSIIQKILASYSLNKQGKPMDELMTDLDFHMSDLDLHQMLLQQNTNQMHLENFRTQEKVQSYLDGYQIFLLTQILMTKYKEFVQLLEAYELSEQILYFLLCNYFQKHHQKGFEEFGNIIYENERCIDEYYKLEIVKITSISNFTDLQAYMQSNTLYKLKHKSTCILKFHQFTNEQEFQLKLYDKFQSLNTISKDHPIYKEIGETIFHCFMDSYQIENDEVLAHRIVNIDDPDDEIITWWKELDEITFTQQFTKLFYHYSGLSGDTNQALLYYHSKLASSPRLMMYYLYQFRNLLWILYTMQGSMEDQRYQYYIKNTAIKDGLLELPYYCKLPLELFTANQMINNNETIKFELNKLQYKTDKSLINGIYDNIIKYLDIFVIQMMKGFQQTFDCKFDILGAIKGLFEKAVKQVNNKYMEILSLLNEFQVIGESSSNNIIIIISGFLTKDDDMLLKLFHLIDPNSKVLRFNWYSSCLGETITALLAFTIGVYIASKICNPIIIKNLFKDWDWTWFAKIHKLAKSAGYKLAELIVSNYSRCNIKLIGHSLGTVVIYYCLERLEQLSEHKMIQDILLMGGVQDVADWGKLSYKNVFGKIINTYSKWDWVLWIFINLYTNPCGFHPILNHKGIANIQKDIGHTDYFDHLPDIVRQSDFGKNIHDLYDQ